MDAEGRLYVLEVNPLPGLTPGYSDLVLISRAIGMEYDQLIAEIMVGGLRRLREKRREEREMETAGARAKETGAKVATADAAAKVKEAAEKAEKAAEKAEKAAKRIAKLAEPSLIGAEERRRDAASKANGNGNGNGVRAGNGNGNGNGNVAEADDRPDSIH
jgi:D-alanine-D-alanine ligase